MITICEFTFAVSAVAEIRMPEGAQIIHVGALPHDCLCMWAIVDTDAPEEWRRFYIFGTGVRLTDLEGIKFIGTVFQDHIVWHVFENVS